MMTSSRSTLRDFVLAGLAIIIALAAGIGCLGKPLRMVQLLTIIGLSMTAGVAWARAVWRVRQVKTSDV